MWLDSSEPYNLYSLQPEAIPPRESLNHFIDLKKQRSA